MIHVHTCIPDPNSYCNVRIAIDFKSYTLSIQDMMIVPHMYAYNDIKSIIIILDDVTLQLQSVPTFIIPRTCSILFSKLVHHLDQLVVAP